MRPLVSYDDLTDNKFQESDNVTFPPKKKRRTNRNSNKKNSHSATVQNHSQRDRTAVASKPTNSTHGLREESRQLTREDIWDDSALIDAWNAAAEEYETLNGPDKTWKKEPTHKSPLWYNKPPEQKDVDDSKDVSLGMPSIPAAFAQHFEFSEEMEEAQSEEEDQENSRPLDFNTFVPQHDPSLSFDHNTGKTGFAQVVPPPPQALSSVSVDQAFQNAMGAWYWAGYWTGIYHATSHRKVGPNLNGYQSDNEEEPEEDGEADEIVQSSEAIDRADLIPT